MAAEGGAAAGAGKVRTALFAFGRYQPFTVGHRKLVEKMLEDSEGIENSKVFLYISASCDEIPDENNSRPQKRSRKVEKHPAEKYEDPLTSKERKDFIDKIYKDIGKDKLEVIALEIEADPKSGKMVCPNPAHAIHDLKEKKGFNKIRLYAGSDRVARYKSWLASPTLKVNNGLERNSNSNNIMKSISGTQTRKFALNGNFDSFKNAVKMNGNSLTEENVRELYRLIRRKYRNNNGGAAAAGGGAAAAAAGSYEGGRRKTRKAKKSRRHSRRR